MHEDTHAGDHPLREQLIRALDWESAHIGFDAALARIPKDARGRIVHGLPYSAWQLLEHTRLTQRDILDFCRDPNYEEPHWPDDYWPSNPEPPEPGAWDQSVASFRKDLDDMQGMVRNPSIDLFATIPHGSGQTYLREALLVIDHNAYHLGELVVLGRLLTAA